MEDHERPEPPLAAGEAKTLLGFLDYQRATPEWKTSGLDRAGLPAVTGVSPMTLGGMLKHLACVGEYARHNGHADLLREPAEGSAGE